MQVSIRTFEVMQCLVNVLCDHEVLGRVCCTSVLAGRTNLLVVCFLFASYG